MTTSTITIWHCDAGGCDATAPEKAPGWVSAIYTHGCPEHASHITAHKASLTDQTRGRGRSEKTTWYLKCACGWQPTPNWRTYTSYPLTDAHLRHVASQPTEEETTNG